MSEEGEWFCYTIESCSNPQQIYSDLRRRLLQHNKNASKYTSRFGTNNARLVLKIGPLPRAEALSIEHRLKRYVLKGGGLNGRLKAVAQLLSLPSYITKTVKILDLKSIPVVTTASRQQFQAVTKESDHWVDERRFTFDAELDGDDE